MERELSEDDDMIVIYRDVSRSSSGMKNRKIAEEQTLKDDVSLEEVQEMVRTGKVDVKETDCDGNNILHKVCSLTKDKSEIVEFLVGAGAAVNQVNREHCTPLILCAGRGYLDTLRVLIRHHACVNPHGAAKGQDSALMAAARNGHEACVHELIKHGADISYRNHTDNLLTIACEAGLSSVVKHCLDNGSEKQMRNRLAERTRGYSLSPLQRACVNGHIDCLRILLSSSTYMKVENSFVEGYYEMTTHPTQITLLAAATANENEECVLELLSFGVNIWKYCRAESLLVMAATHGLVKVLKECLNRLDNDEIRRCDYKGKNAIMLACENNKYGCLKELLQSGKFPPEAVNRVSQGFTALMVCAQRGHIECLRLLIHHKAEIEPPLVTSEEHMRYHDAISEANSAVLLAAKSKNEDCVKLLIDAGADIWNRNNKGQNLLMIASQQGLAGTVKYCLSDIKTEQITMADSMGMNVLDHVLENNQVECVKILLSVGRNTIDVLMVVGRQRGSLLHKVCEDTVERPDVVDLLVSNCSLIDSVDGEGCTPLMVCAKKGHLETLKVLLRHGASINAVQSCSQYGGVSVRNTALLFAANAGHEECVLELVNCGVDIWYQNNHGQYLLTVACAKGLPSVVKTCLSKCTETDNGECYSRHLSKALLTSFNNNNENCVLEIMDHIEPSVKKKNKSRSEALLNSASGMGMARVVKKLLETKQYDSEVKNTALLKAVTSKYEECAIALIAHGADILSTNKNGENTFVLAVERKLIGVVDICLKSVSPETICEQNNEGTNILMLAVKKGIVDVVQFCEGKVGSEDLNKKDKEGKSALHHAVYGGQIDTVRALLRYGADPSVIDTENIGRRALVDINLELGLCELIKHGADFQCIDTNGANLLIVAVKLGLNELLKVIIEKADESFLTMTDSEGNNAMSYAIDGRSQQCLEELLKSSKCSAMRGTALIKCPEYFREGRELVEKYCLMVETRSTAIVERTVKLLGKANSYYISEREMLEELAEGIDVWHTDGDGQNLFMIAVAKGMTQVVRFCAAKASHEQIHAVNKKGKTAIMIACDKCVDRNEYLSSRETFKKQESLDTLLEILGNKETFKRRIGQKTSRLKDVDAQIYGDDESLIHFVCNKIEDRADIVGKLIEKGASVNQYNENGRTPLMVCAMRNNIKCLLVLLQHDADVQACTRCTVNVKKVPRKNKAEENVNFGDTSLHLAAIADHEGCVKLLIEHGADIWCCNDRGENLLMIAASRGQWSIVRHCLDRGSPDQINKLDKDGNNAVINACKNAQVTPLVLLLENEHSLLQINVNSVKLDMSPLMVATHFRCPEAVRILLEKGADPNYTNDLGKTCLLTAVGPPRNHRMEAYHEHLKKDPAYIRSINTLLEFGSDVNYVCKQTGESVLIAAAKAGVPAAIIKKLLQQGADVNQCDAQANTPLLSACENGQGNVIELLLNHGASVEKASGKSGTFLLPEAVSQGVNPQAVKMLIDHGACVNQVDSHGNTALLNACRNSQENVIDMLLQKEADVSICNISGDSSLLLVVQNGISIESVSKLLKYGANVNHANKDNNTALFKACERGEEGVMKLLLEHGATSSHTCNVSGDTTLILALKNNCEVDIIERLFRTGSDVNHANNAGDTALRISCSKRNLKQVKLLLQNGASVVRDPMEGSVSYRYRPFNKLIHLAGMNVSGEQNPTSPGEGIVPRLFDLCRVPARQHVMKCFPDSNLFHTVPRLVLPNKMKRFLLHDYDIDDDDDQVPEVNKSVSEVRYYICEESSSDDCYYDDDYGYGYGYAYDSDDS